MPFCDDDLTALFDCSSGLDSFGGIDVHEESLHNVVSFDLFTSSQFLSEHLHLPTDGASLRLISPRQGWSSCSLILAIQELEHIKELYITTLCIGKKELVALSQLDVPHVYITLGTITQRYADEIATVANEKSWHVKYTRNHSKVILIKTHNAFYIIETSSNLNENPQIEQFCITNSKAVFDFYMTQMQKLRVWDV